MDVLSMDLAHKIHKRHANRYLTKLDAFNRRYLIGGDQIDNVLDLFDKDYPQIELARNWAASHADTDDECAQFTEDYADWGVDLLLLRKGAAAFQQWAADALKAAQRLGLRRAECVHYGNLGICFRLIGNPTVAIEHLEKALSLSVEIEDVELQGIWNGDLGSVYLDLRQFELARSRFEAALEIAEELNDHRRIGNWSNNLGTVFSQLGDLENATKFYLHALDKHLSVGDKRSTAITFDSLGSAMAQQGRATTAIEYHGRAFQLAQTLNDQRIMANAAGNLALALAQMGSYKQAIENHLIAIDLYGKLGDAKEQIIEYNRLGDAQRRIGAFEDSRASYNSALTKNDGIGEVTQQIRALSGLGIIHRTLGEFKQSIENHEYSYELAHQAGLREYEHEQAGCLAQVMFEIRNYDAAVALYEHSSAIAREIGDNFNLVQHLANLANVLNTVGQPQEAIIHLRDALKFAETHQHARAVGALLGNIGNSYRSLGEKDTAIDHYRRALEISVRVGDTHNTANWHSNLAVTLAECGHFAEAEIHFAAAEHHYSGLGLHHMCDKVRTNREILLGGKTPDGGSLPH